MTQEKGIRQTPGGKFELTISHRMLPGGRVMRNFSKHEDAAAYKARMLLVLNQGILPVELTREGARSASGRTERAKRPVVSVPAPTAVVRKGSQSPALADALADYLKSDSAKIARSDYGTLEALQRSLTGNLDGVQSTWLDTWVRHMKRHDKLAPGTIRKKVESLARCIDWWHRKTHPDGNSPPNVLRLLPVGYSSYAADDGPAPKHGPRDRRLHHGEYELIESVLQGFKRPERERAYCRSGDADFLMLFRLITNTGLRLREAYRLRVSDIKYDLRTIHIAKSKTGAKRDVPMTRQMEAWLRAYTVDRVGVVFPYWQGSEDEDVLAAVSSRLSRKFGTLFTHCDCIELTEHDLRHEATCRWVEKRDAAGAWMFRSEEVMKITGHMNAQMFLRYLSLRGSDLASRLD